jgi:hypothetical protein
VFSVAKRTRKRRKRKKRMVVIDWPVEIVLLIEIRDSLKNS